MFGRDEALRPKNKIKTFLRRTKTHDRGNHPRLQLVGGVTGAQTDEAKYQLPGGPN